MPEEYTATEEPTTVAEEPKAPAQEFTEATIKGSPKFEAMRNFSGGVASYHNPGGGGDIVVPAGGLVVKVTIPAPQDKPDTQPVDPDLLEALSEHFVAAPKPVDYGGGEDVVFYFAVPAIADLFDVSEPEPKEEAESESTSTTEPTSEASSLEDRIRGA